MTAVALATALTLLAALAVLQVLLVLGMPFGRLTWGGAHRVLPRRLRLGSAVSVLLYAGFAALLLSRAGVLAGGDSAPVTVMTWILFAYFTFGILLNAVSRSRAERWTMAPVCLVLALATLSLALRG